MYTFSTEDLKDLCRNICLQLALSGSSCLDRETYYYAVYWKLCDSADQCAGIGMAAGSRASIFRDYIREFARQMRLDSTTILNLADNIIEAQIRSNYPLTEPPKYENNGEMTDSGEAYSGRKAAHT